MYLVCMYMIHTIYIHDNKKDMIHTIYNRYDTYYLYNTYDTYYLYNTYDTYYLYT